jgi:hypothetical protein
MDVREAVAETLKRLKEINEKLSDFETIDIAKLESKALESADIINEINGRFEPQICILGLLRIGLSEKKIAEEVTKRGVHTGMTSINRYKRAKKQTAAPERTKKLRKIYEEKVESKS